MVRFDEFCATSFYVWEWGIWRNVQCESFFVSSFIIFCTSLVPKLGTDPDSRWKKPTVDFCKDYIREVNDADECLGVNVWAVEDGRHGGG